ncbi:MAG: hypothetical protein K9L26_04405 [Candidatus Izimaplasma sp.]|nr:hypothetical protein [Candidatus Izimaplasma bacterium]
MAKRYVYQKSSTGVSDFVYVDLLPEVKRARQFNVNVVVALLLGVVLSFIFIYLPYRDATLRMEELNGLNNDLQHELTLTQEEITGYEIDLQVIDFQEDIAEIEQHRINFNNYIDDLELITQLHGGRINRVSYDQDISEIQIDVAIVTPFSYNILNNQILNLDWVITSGYSTPQRFGGDVEYVSTFTIEVNTDAQ